MAQFTTGKNPPWVRDAASLSQPGIVSMAQPGVGLANQVLTQSGVATHTVYSLGTTQPAIAPQQYNPQQLGVASIQNAPAGPPPAIQPTVQLSQVGVPGVAMPTTLATSQQVATISYPAPRMTSSGPPAGPPKQQRVFTGTVTKLHDNFGFVDEDVFFQTSCVKGMIPKVGDRVLVEASYNANMPFKWNAARIQVLPNQPPVPTTSQVTFNQTPAFNQSPANFNQSPANFNQNSANFNPNPVAAYQVKAQIGSAIPPPVIAPPTLSQPPPLMGQQTQPTANKRDKGLLQSSLGRSAIIPPRRLENQGFRDRDRGRDRDRDRHIGHERRERRSPRKRSRSPRRSKSPSSRRSPQRRRGQTRIVPRYMVQVPKLSLDGKEANVIALRSRYANLYIPSDFFHTQFSWVDAFPLHRPFSLGNPCTFHVMSKDVEPLNKADTLDPSDADHLYSAKVMLLSTPPMDDFYRKSCALTEDPADVKEAFQHPTRLIQFLVGMKGKSEPMAIGGPWSPSLDGPNPDEDPRVLINTAIRTTRYLTGVDLSNCTQWYRFCEIRYHRPEEMHKGRMVPARVETVVIFLPDVWSCGPTRLEWEQLQTAYKKQLQDKLLEESKDDTQEEEDEAAEGEAETTKDPTHYAELDPKIMKVADLRRELEARQLSCKGLKSQLIARLTKALKSEQEKEEQDAENKDEHEEKKVEEEKKIEVDEKEEEQKRKDDEDRRKKEEKEKASREKRYQLPENPAILVHPSSTAKSGKFECTSMSLSVLLDYRPEDNKEHSFEVSLFAELFNEMLMRDFGFRIFKALMAVPEQKKEEKEKKDDKEKKEDKEEKEATDEPSSKKPKIQDGEEKEDKKDQDDKDKSTKDKDDKDKSTKDKDDKDKSTKDKDDKDKSTKDKKDRDDKKDERDKEDEKSRDGDDDDDDDDQDEDQKDKDRDRHKSHEKDKKREKVKYYSADTELLLAFVYFDQTHTGYILDKDVEEIMHTLGLQLSRSQVKKLVQKLVTRDTLNYRKLTDKPLPKDGDKESEEPMEEGSDNVVPDETLLAMGNLPFLEARRKEGHSEAEVSPRSKKSSKSKDEGETSSSESSGFVMYNGAMVDIHSIMLKLERSEKTRSTVESRLKDIQDEMDMLKTSFSSSEQNSQKVASELQELKKRLRDQKKQTESAESNAKRFQDVLSKSKSALSSVLSDIRSVASSSSSDDSKSEVKRDVKQEVNGD